MEKFKYFNVIMCEYGKCNIINSGRGKKANGPLWRDQLVRVYEKGDYRENKGTHMERANALKTPK